MLSEMLEDFYETQNEEIIQDFKLMLWSSKYIYKRYKKSYSFDVNKDKLLHRKDLIELFDKHSKTEVFYCKSFYNDEMDSIDYIKVHINNMYGYLADKDVYMPKEYYQYLDKPKQIYFQTIKEIEDGKNVDYKSVEYKIEFALEQALKIKEEKLKRKINITFSEYEKLIDQYIERLFSNYLPPHEYEKDNGWELRNGAVGWSEDNYVIKYFCRSLTGYMQNYVREMHKPVKRCVDCKNEIGGGNRKVRCDSCVRKYRNAYQRKLMRKKRRLVSR